MGGNRMRGICGLQARREVPGRQIAKDQIARDQIALYRRALPI